MSAHTGKEAAQLKCGEALWQQCVIMSMLVESPCRVVDGFPAVTITMATAGQSEGIYPIAQIGHSQWLAGIEVM